MPPAQYDPFTVPPSTPRGHDSIPDAIWRAAIALDPAAIKSICEKANACAPAANPTIHEAVSAACRSLSSSIAAKSAPDLPQAALSLLAFARGGFAPEAIGSLPDAGVWPLCAKASFLGASVQELSSLASKALRSGDVAGLILCVASGARLLPEEARLWSLFAVDNAPEDRGQCSYWIGAGYSKSSPKEQGAAAEAIREASLSARPDPWMNAESAQAWRDSVASCLSFFQKGLLEFGGMSIPHHASAHKSI